MKNFFKTVRFYSLIIIIVGAMTSFIPFALSGFNLDFIARNKKIVREDNKQKVYACELLDISLIQIDVNNTNVTILPSNSSDIKVTYFENNDEKYNIYKTKKSISINYKNINPPKGSLTQRIPFFKNGNPSRYENNELIIEIPEFYSGDISFTSQKGNLYDNEPLLFDGPLKINGLKNINNLNIDFSSELSIENVSCKNGINISTENRCNLKDVFSENSIKISTVVGEINLDSVSSNNILNIHSEDGPININKIYADKIQMSSHLKVSGTIYGKEIDYITKKVPNIETETFDIYNPENKKILITSNYSYITFTENKF